jgi:hypothetical protein
MEDLFHNQFVNLDVFVLCVFLEECLCVVEAEVRVANAGIHVERRHAWVASGERKQAKGAACYDTVDRVLVVVLAYCPEGAETVVTNFITGVKNLIKFIDHDDNFFAGPSMVVEGIEKITKGCNSFDRAAVSSESVAKSVPKSRFVFDGDFLQ